MSRLDDLPPDQRATLSLLLRTRKSYREVAELLHISERAVHDRAHAALAVLAAKQARALSPEQRAEVGDYLLGQRAGVGERLATRSYLEGSAQAHAWASALVDELRPLGDARLPEIPPVAADATAAPTVGVGTGAGSGDDGREGAARGGRTDGRPGALRRSLSSAPSSRRAGAAVLVAIAAVVAVAVVLIVNSGGSSGGADSGRSSAGVGAGATGAGTTATSSAKAKEDHRVTLTSPDPTSKAVGIAEVLSEGSQYAFYLAAEHLAPSKGFFYGVWLYNSPSSFEALSRAPNVGSNGSLQGGALLPKDAAKFHTMLLTRETSASPTRPGPVVLRGAFALH
jgi:hypothetical protein